MNVTCSLCDAPCEAGEALCPSCLADPVQCAAYDEAAREASRTSAIARWRRAAITAIRMARVYRAEGGDADERARACVERARRCRDAVRRVRTADGDVARLVGPGLRKAVPSSEKKRTRRASSR